MSFTDETFDATRTIAIAHCTGRDVEIEVTDYKYSCCGGGWQPRPGTATYTGKVVDFDTHTTRFRLVCRNDIGGKPAQVMSSCDRVLGVRFVD